MKTLVRHSALFALIGLVLSPLAVSYASSPPDSVPSAPFDYEQWRRDHPRPAAKRLAGLNVGEPRTVRLLYFLPKDRTPRQDIDAKLDEVMKNVQLSFEEVMEYHGFGRRTFTLETDAAGKAVVHHVKGKFNGEYYHTDTFRKVIFEETAEQFDLSANIYLVVLDVSKEPTSGCGQGRAWGIEGGVALIPAPFSDRNFEFGWSCLNVRTTAHELGHTFGLEHDNLRNATLSPSSYHTDFMVTSFCAAEWLDAHRYFNRGQTYPQADKPTTIQMLPPLAVPPNAVRLRFEGTDPDGLHQAQLHKYFDNAIDCQGLDGESASVEFVTHEVAEAPWDRVRLRVVDVYGNVTEHWETIDITALLPAEVVSIPDANLAAVVRETLGLAPGDAISQLDMLRLERLEATGRQITDLTGLEYAVNLADLHLGDNQISDITPLAESTLLSKLELYNNNISDISPLAGLTRLVDLNIDDTSVSDISPLAGSRFTLQYLSLYGTSVSDISPLARLTHLLTLVLGGTSVSDISPLAGLTHLSFLALWDNSVSDISPLVGLNRLGVAWLKGNPLSYASIHTHIPILLERGVEVTHDETFTATPHSLTKVSGDGQEGLAGIALAAPFVVSVLDADGAAIDGVAVTFSVTAGEGILSDTTATTDANGHATTTLTLTLGSDVETNTVSATVEGLESVTFTATAVGQAIPDSLVKVSGDGQEGTAITQLDEPLVVFVSDAEGAAMAGVVVSFAVTAGGGTLSDTTATTDANGRAATWLTLGIEAGINAVEATVEGLEPVTFTATAQESPFAGLFDLFRSGKRVALPDSTQLLQNAPNPFNSQTVLPYFLPVAGPVRVEVFALTGQRVATLRQGPQSAGHHRLYWNGLDAEGRPLASGIYLYRLATDFGVLTRKLMLLR